MVATTLDQVALSVDGSLSLEDGSSATCMILWHHDLSVIFAACQVVFNSNKSLEVKIHALMQGMAFAIQHTNLPIIVQSDSIEVVSIF